MFCERYLFHYNIILMCKYIWPIWGKSMGKKFSEKIILVVPGEFFEVSEILFSDRQDPMSIALNY